MIMKLNIIIINNNNSSNNHNINNNNSNTGNDNNNYNDNNLVSLPATFQMIHKTEDPQKSQPTGSILISLCITVSVGPKSNIMPSFGINFHYFTK